MHKRKQYVELNDCALDKIWQIQLVVNFYVN